MKKIDTNVIVFNLLLGLGAAVYVLGDVAISYRVGHNHQEITKLRSEVEDLQAKLRSLQQPEAVLSEKTLRG